ncbi:MAG TPA: MFS transporter [Atribacteraceae bacterium]|nr:MFS transporter [Atribacteraceae bacterium]
MLFLSRVSRMLTVPLKKASGVISRRGLERARSLSMNRFWNRLREQLAPHESMSAADTYRGLSYILKDGLVSQVMVALTGGVILVDFAVRLGASNLIIGILAAIPSLAHLMQVPTVYLIERYRNRHMIVFISSLGSRLFLLFLVAIPFLSSADLRLLFLSGGLLLHALANSVTSCSWHSWMHDFIPHNKLGSFFSGRMSMSQGLGMVVSLTSGYFLDYWRRAFPAVELYGYALLFSLGIIAGLMSVYYLVMTPEPRMKPPEKQKSFLSLLSLPFQTPNFRNLIIFLTSWNFAVNLAAPFFTVYMLRGIGLSLSYIILLSVLSQFMNIMFLGIWGKFSDRFSNKAVLRVSGPLFIVCILAWTFTMLPDVYILTVPLLILIHIFSGISTAGVTLSSLNIGLKLAPRGQGTVYLATNSLCSAIVAGIAPIIGGQFVDYFRYRQLSWTIKWSGPEGDLAFRALDFHHWDFFFFIAFLIGLYSLHRLTLVKEEGEIKEKIVLKEFLSEVKHGMWNLSTAGGLRSLVEGVYPLFRNSPRKKVPDKTA